MQINERVLFFFPRWISVRRVHEQKSDYWENYYRDLYLSNNADGDTVWRAWRLKKKTISSLFLKSYPVLCGSPPLFITSTVSGHSTAGESFRESAPLPTRAHSVATLENFLPNRKNTDKVLSVRCTRTAEQMFGAQIIIFFASVVPPVEGSCRLHNWDYTLSPRGRASANKKKRDSAASLRCPVAVLSTGNRPMGWKLPFMDFMSANDAVEF